jgi:hypothetical protein
MASMETVGIRLLERGKIYSVKQLQLIKLHKDKFDIEQDIKVLEAKVKDNDVKDGEINPVANDETEDKPNNKPKDPKQTDLKSLSSKASQVLTTLESMEFNIERLVKISNEEDLSLEKLAKQYTELRMFTLLFKAISKKITEITGEFQTGFYKPDEKSFGKDSSARHYSP